MDGDQVANADKFALPHPGGGFRGAAAAVGAGALLGLVNSASNVFGSAYGPYTTTPGQGVLWLEYVSAWVGSAGTWAMFAFAVGWVTCRFRAGMLRAVLGLLTAVVSYYLCDAALGMSAGFSVYPLLFWSVAAVVIAPVMAALGVLAQENTGWSLLAGLAAPLLVVYFTATQPTGPDHIRPWSQWAVYAAAAALAAALTVRAGFSHRADSRL